MNKIYYSLTVIFCLFIYVSCSTESTPVYTLFTSASPTEAGAVSPISGEFEEGESVELTAQPNENWVFDSWQGGLTGNTNPASITMNSDADITALFIKRDYPLTVETEGEGTVTERVVQAKTTDYPHGTTVELTANPADGWEFVEWQGDVNGDQNPQNITVEGETSVIAVFKLSDDSDPFVRLTIDWNQLQSLLTTNSKLKNVNAETEGEITHFGARLVYVEENAVFIQSVERSGEEDQGLITLEVPPTEKAFLLVAAVSNINENQALLFGTMDSVSVNRGTEYDWSIENIEWMVPEWTVIDSLKSDYENGLLTADKDDAEFELTIQVMEPYYPLLRKYMSSVTYNDEIIQVNGTGGMYAYNEETGLRDFRFIFKNPTVGTSNTEFYGSSFPRFDNQKFNLPSSEYIVFEKIEMEISWE